MFVERLWRSVKYVEVVCCERNRSHSDRLRCLRLIKQNTKYTRLIISFSCRFVSLILIFNYDMANKKVSLPLHIKQDKIQKQVTQALEVVLLYHYFY